MGAVNTKAKKYGSISPGPGVYAVNDSYKKIKDVSLSFSMGSKMESGLVNKSVLNNPGPGSYPLANLKAVLRSDGFTKFSQGERKGLVAASSKYSVSPNKYLPSTKIIERGQANYSFGTGSRPATGQPTLAPGPGHYPTKSIVGSESQGKTLGKRFKPKHEEPGSNLVPGPGTYGSDFSPIKHAQPKWRMGSS